MPNTYEDCFSLSIYCYTCKKSTCPNGGCICYKLLNVFTLANATEAKRWKIFISSLATISFYVHHTFIRAGYIPYFLLLLYNTIQHNNHANVSLSLISGPLVKMRCFFQFYHKNAWMYKDFICA